VSPVRRESPVRRVCPIRRWERPGGRRQRQADSQADDGYTSRGKLSALACVRAVQDLAQLRKQREDGGPLAVVSQLQCRLLSRHAQKLRLAGHNDRQCITMVHRDVRRLTQLCVAYVNAPKSAPVMSSLEGSITSRPSTIESTSPRDPLRDPALRQGSAKITA